MKYMATLAVHSAMNSEKIPHPFFTKPSVRSEIDESTSGDESKLANGISQLDGADSDSTNKKRSRRPRKSRLSAQNNGKSQKTLQEIINPASNDCTRKDEDSGQEIPDSCPPETSPPPKRKRRRTSESEYTEVEPPNSVAEYGAEAAPETRNPRRGSPQVLIPASSPLPNEMPEAKETVTKTPPKKMLRLNASGTFSSPISKNDQALEPPAENPKRRGRPRKSKEADNPKQTIVVIRYANVALTGPRIDCIMAGEERVEMEKVSRATPKKQRTPRKPQPPKVTHPFFLGKPKEPQPAAKQESPRKASAVTPGKLRRQTMSERSPKQTTARATQDYVVGSGLLKDRLMLKHAGAKEPSWPSKEYAHVRGLDEVELDDLRRISQVSPIVGTRKRKTANIPIQPDESLLQRFAGLLEPDEEGNLRSDGFQEPHPSLTLPRKLLISGRDIAERVVHEISAPLTERDVEELANPHGSQVAIHPAISSLYDRLPRSLSAFDEDKGETTSWAHKYAPTNAAEVLQPRREMNILKNWLIKLTITAVEGSMRIDASAPLKPDSKPKKKRRRKAADMDDFLVSDDDKSHDMDELSEPEDVALSSLGGQKTLKSIVQVASEGVKSSNTVLLSGPHGCGKTAAAHAVAKELGFKVFEISPCERRSGKDIMDKVGDMTENHLMKHHGADPGETSSAEQASKIDEAFQKDLDSGRQGKMNAFFMPKTAPKKPSPKKKAVQKKAVLESVQKAIRKPPKDQQQSLILLEEVDVLFKDDKDFWSTVFKLIESSKRPFIMTCNDEDLVPLQAMSLHAILRFTPPSVDMATDYMLLLAASEGHLLKRGAVQSLYHSRGCDLRASIAELDFWCQMGIGDPLGGLSWIFQRYPPGSDLDKAGLKLRVVSEGTYVTGMGVLPNGRLDNEARLLQAQHEFDVDSVDLFNQDGLPSGGTTLRMMSQLADSMSAADIYTGRYYLQDLTQPPMTDKSRSQYIESLQLLQTDEHIDYSDMTAQIRIATALAAHSALLNLSSEQLLLKLRSAIQSKERLSKWSKTLRRRDFACFDAISVPSENVLFATPGLTQSAFDGPLMPIATDIAPYVRSILQFDLALANQREQLSGLAMDARHTKRARTTRAARSALEGGQRASTRREKWFTKDLDSEAVLTTAGHDWPKTGLEALDCISRDGTETPKSTAESAQFA